MRTDFAFCGSQAAAIRYAPADSHVDLEHVHMEYWLGILVYELLLRKSRPNQRYPFLISPLTPAFDASLLFWVFLDKAGRFGGRYDNSTTDAYDDAEKDLRTGPPFSFNSAAISSRFKCIIAEYVA